MHARHEGPVDMRRAAIAVLAALGISACGDDVPAEGGSTGTTTAEPGTTTTGSMDTSSSTDAADESTGTTGETELTREEQILADLDTAMYECPDRVWPGDTLDNYRSRQVLLVSNDQDRGWLWNDQVNGQGDPPRVSSGPLEDLPAEWTASLFNFGVIYDLRTVGISLDLTQEYNDELLAQGEEIYIDFATSLTFHEAFHFLSDQDDWNAGLGSRRTPYPEPWEPRYLRAALTAALRDALENDAPLGAATYWHEQMQQDFAEELDQFRPLEITEGAAEYASLVSSALAMVGCDAPEDALLAEAVAHLDDGFQGTGYSAGREPYDLGPLAGLLLRRDEVSDWEATVESGTPPVEQVLQGVAADPQPDDPRLQADVQTAVDERNVAVGMEIEPMLADLESPSAIRVVVSFNWLSGSFSLGGFYYLPDLMGEPDVYLRLSMLLEPPSGIDIQLFEETSLVGVSTPCALGAGPTIVLTLPADEVTVMGGLATSTAPTAVFDGLLVEETTDMMGLAWLCPVDAGGAAAPPGEPPVGIGDGPPPAATPSWPWRVEAGPDGRLLVRP